MRLGDHSGLKAAAVLVGVAVLSATIGIGVSARMNGGWGQDPGQGMGPGPQGRGMGMRGGGPGGPGGPGGGPFGFLGPAARELNLTDAQRQQIKAIAEKHRDEMKAIQDRMQPARKALDAAITADAFDENAIRAAAAEVAGIEADGAVLRAKVHQEGWKVLTPEQQQKARELQSQMEQRMKDGRGGRGPGRGPGMMMRERFQHQAPQSSDKVSDQESGRPEVA